MSEGCPSCGAKFIEATTFKAPNKPVAGEVVSLINHTLEKSYGDLCTKCGGEAMHTAIRRIEVTIAKRISRIEDAITDFPLLTTTWLPENIEVRFINLVTANVTIGTGLFNEWSQGLADLVGAVNVNSGMTFKVNKGEAVARTILVNKAVALGANCVLGVDVDYGVTANNAATINMQGTAATISNLDALLSETDAAKAESISKNFRDLDGFQKMLSVMKKQIEEHKWN